MPDISRIEIQGTVYKARNFDEISLDDLLMFDAQAADAGYPITFDQVQAMFEGVEEDGSGKTLTVREAFVAQAVVVWLTLRGEGKDVTFKQAASIPGDQIKDVPSPGDRKAPKAKKAAATSRPSSSPVEASDPLLVEDEASQWETSSSLSESE